ncbi:MAG: uroporphyrinogen decarboxylase family protein [Armatimonadota bacterium]
MPTRRQHIAEVFAGVAPAVPPVSMRLDLWHRDAVSRGTLPDVLACCSVEDIEDRLGFCRSARYRAHPKLVFPDGWVQECDDGEAHRTSYRFPAATVEKVERRTPDQARAGMRGAIVNYPVSSETGCRALLAALEQASLVADLDGFTAFDRAVGDAGLPMLIIGSCPTHTLMLEWFGYEHFFYALADYPDTLAALIETLEALFRRALWDRVLASPAELILHGNHFADATTPPPLFRRFFLPYFRTFNDRAHAAGKRVVWHADAAMGALLDLVLEAGFDGADCLATAPLVPETLEEYHRAWQGRIVCWGGLPGTVFNPEFPEPLFADHLRQLAEFTRGKPGFIIGASDNVMPGALWERVVAVRDAFMPALSG